MTHLTNRHQLVAYVADHAPNRVVQMAIDRGRVTHHGLFKGGWVISATYHGQVWVVGVRCMGMPPKLVCGLLRAVPWGEYVGGETVLAEGDQKK